jgi:hypothetical protein
MRSRSAAVALVRISVARGKRTTRGAITGLRLYI